MKTNALAQTRLIALLTAGAENTNTNDGSAVTRPELAAAYAEFAAALETLAPQSESLPHTLRCLYYLRTELHALQRSLCCGAKKKSTRG